MRNHLKEFGACTEFQTPWVVDPPVSSIPASAWSADVVVYIPMELGKI